VAPGAPAGGDLEDVQPRCLTEHARALLRVIGQGPEPHAPRTANSAIDLSTLSLLFGH
jgi:hypothetical protein